LSSGKFPRKAVKHFFMEAYFLKQFDCALALRFSITNAMNSEWFRDDLQNRATRIKRRKGVLKNNLDLSMELFSILP
jgi:hypothetical protein